MKLKILFIGIFSFILTSCGAKKAVVKNNKVTTVSEPKPTKIFSVGQEKHVNKLVKNNPNLNKNISKYIKNYAPIAVQEMHASNIPASITLAQGILESGSGKSVLAKKSNNHFGIKCHSKWAGERVYHNDDKRGECFRKYKYVETSYKDHSAFLLNRKRYAFLFNYNKKDYKNWAKGLRKAGYATDRKYPQKLIKLIKTYKLYEFDNVKNTNIKTNKSKYKVDKIKKPKKLEGKIYIVKKGDTLYAISKKFNISVQDLKSYNNLKNNNLEIGKALIVK